MIVRIDWNEPNRFKIERSETFWPWGQDTVNVYRRSDKDPDRWELILPDFSASVLRMCKFPRLLCTAAELTASDGHVRLIGQGKLINQGEKLTLVTRKTKPKLVLRREV